MKVNGKRMTTEESRMALLSLRETWNKGDVVDVTLPMEPRFIVARDEVKADSGRVALGVGPVVYCLEEADNGKVREIKVDPETRWSMSLTETIMGGVGDASVQCSDG